jgi:hypothetical protein
MATGNITSLQTHFRKPSAIPWPSTILDTLNSLPMSKVSLTDLQDRIARQQPPDCFAACQQPDRALKTFVQRRGSLHLLHLKLT